MKIFKLLITLFFPILIWGQTSLNEQLSFEIKQKNYDKGLQIINNIISNKKYNNTTYYYKAFCEQEKGLFDSSITSATIALLNTSKTDTLFQDILLLRSISYAAIGNLNLGILDNETLVNEFPYNIDYLINLSYLYGETQQLDKCFKIMYQGLLIDSINICLLNNLAFTYCEAKMYAQAIEFATKGLALTKDSMWIATLLNSLGLAQGMTISVKKGLQTIKRSLSYKSDNAFAYFNIGLLYIKQNEIENACLNFKKAKQLGGINLTLNYINEYCK